MVAIVGMAGAGKSQVTRVFQRHGFTAVRFGDVTDRELAKEGLKPNEENERYVRQRLREQHGMAAYARLNLPRIDGALRSSDVVLDGLYSWEEYTLLKDHYGEQFSTVAVWASPATRYRRLSRRAERALTPEEAAGRDIAEIERSSKGGPIAMADFVIDNEGALGETEKQTECLIAALR